MTTTPKKLTYMMMTFSAKGEVTSTLPPVPKSTVGARNRPARHQHEEVAQREKTRKYT